MLIDANVLLYAVDTDSPFHEPAHAWLESTLNGNRRVGIPWSSLTAFVRIATHPRALREPMTAHEAWSFVDDWLDAPTTWIPQPGRAHREVLGRLVRDLDLRANLVSDAVLAALCIEHGLVMVSADSDFARFTEISWLNPVQR
ncbi:TA system VapC family ribonuclease toxin [Mycobacterium hubeiense]|uniref:TA system VapC family ribonuclease toxin n=1 Tax=Mycobacterium hubeiense TaxID=1867256 RepID=UPI000C7EDA41|nr:TA system VapC family ribonuclease toxin [Mycobacterium sp. QGD 101]